MRASPGDTFGHVDYDGFQPVVGVLKILGFDPRRLASERVRCCWISGEHAGQVCRLSRAEVNDKQRRVRA